MQDSTGYLLKYNMSTTALHYLLNMVNVPDYAYRRYWKADHTGSKQVHGITWQCYALYDYRAELTYRVRVRCQNSNFNNIIEADT